MDLLFIIYFTAVSIACIVGFIVCLIICLVEEVYNMDYVLNDKSEFLKCVFQLQIVVFQSKEYVNNLGVVILEILTTLFFWPLNIMVLSILLGAMAIKFVVWIFLKIFGKKYKEEN